MTTATMEKTGAKVVSHAEWLATRKQFLEREKELTQLRDDLARQRRELPMEKVEKNYMFDGPSGKVTLADLFGGRSQPIIALLIESGRLTLDDVKVAEKIFLVSRKEAKKP